MKKPIVAVSVLIAAAVFVLGCNQAAQETQTPPIWTKVAKGTLVEMALATGEIVPRHEIAVKSKITGLVAHLFVEEGDVVEVGQPLVEIRPDPTPLELAQAKRTLEMRLLSRDRRMVEKQRLYSLLTREMVAQADYDRAQEAYQQANLAFNLAREELALIDQGKALIAGEVVETIIKSPVAGSILELRVDVGDSVVPLTSFQPGTELVYISDMRELLFEGNVDEIDIGKIREDMKAAIRLGALPEETIRGRLAKVALKARKQERTTVFDVEIDQLEIPAGVLLCAGYSANADIETGRADDALIIPEASVEYRADSAFVRVLTKTGDAQEVFVELGLADGIRVEVVRGLSLGDRVLERNWDEAD